MSSLRQCLHLSSRPCILGRFFPTAFYSTAAGLPPCTEEDLLQRSILPTDHFQRSMPRLKVPKLEDSLKKYLASQQAYLETGEDLERTKTAVEEFKKGPGPGLQKELEAFAKANSHTSYVTDLWFDRYLRDRSPVVLTHNPVMFFNDSALGPNYNKVEIRATNMIYSAMRMMRSYRASLLDPEMFHLNAAKTDTVDFRKKMKMFPKIVSWYGAYLYKVYPLDMSQMKNLFNSTRIPTPVKDQLFADPTARHVLVIRKGKHYVFDILDEQGHGISPKQILSNILFILQQPGAEPSDPPSVGNLTAADRDTWSAARQHLVDLGNQETLKKIDSAAFAVVLDDEVFDDSQISEQIMHNLHGPGDNRWFDKSFSLFFSPKGRTALNFEHSWGDGVGVLRLFNEVFHDIDKRPVVHPGDESNTTSLPSSKVDMLPWKLDDTLSKETLPQAKAQYDQWRSSLDYCYAESDAMSKILLKAAQLGPDSMMQLSFQMAYFKLHGKVPATYESCSTSAFKCGRTETVRSATEETRAFTWKMHKMGGVESSAAELRAALEACSKKHNKLTVEAAMGQGWDRHLFMLSHLATQRSPTSLPSLYQDPAYKAINQILMSTSTLTSPALLWGAFAAVHPEGYGAGYGILDRGCGLGVSSWKGAKDANTVEFISAWLASVQEIAQVINSSSPSAPTSKK